MTTTTNSTSATSFRRLDVVSLKTDETYQRILGPGHVKSIVRDFDPVALGVLEISDRGHEDYYVLDGQHRVNACRTIGYREVDCRVHHGLGRAREADLFLKLNFERAPAPVQRWAARVVSHDPKTESLLTIAEERGFTISPKAGGTPTNLTAVTSIDNIYARHGGPGLGYTLEVVRDAWPDIADGRDGTMLKGIALFLSKYPAVRRTELAGKLSSIPAGEIHKRRQSYRDDYRCSAPEGVARVILKHFNWRRSSSRLPNVFDA
jgi:hypothetical protein